MAGDGERFDVERGVLTVAGCLLTILLWAAILTACGRLLRG